MKALTLSGRRPKTTVEGCNSLRPTGIGAVLRSGVFEQACLVEDRSAPPPAHPFPIRT
jgi:hypothetical protein